MPQVVVGNENVFRRKDWVALQAACPPQVTLVRQKSAWSSSELRAQIIRWLGTAIRPYSRELQPILFIDAARIHTTSPVLRACVAERIWPVVIPAKTTWLLQPLDVSGFRAFKVALQNRYQHARAASGVRDLAVAAFLQCLYTAIEDTLGVHQWAVAFDGVGCGRAQLATREKVLNELQLQTPLVVDDDRPSLAQLQHCFPRGTDVPVAVLWR